MEKIIIFSTFYDPYMSGAERMVKEVVERLQDRYSFIIITARLSRRLTPSVVLRLRQTLGVDEGGIKIVRIGFGFKFDKYLYPILAPFYALRYRPKIVHAVMESYAGIALLIFRYLLSLTKFLIPNSSFLILTLQSGDLDLQEKQARIPTWLWKQIHTAPDLVVSIGNSMASRARTLGAENVRVIPNGVNLQLIHENIRTQEHKNKETDDYRHRIICVARLSPEKGLEYLIDAMPEVLKEFPDAKLVLVGDGILRQKLQVISYKLQAQITFLGNLPHEQTLKEIAHSDVLVLPSLAEGMGIVLVEAQALGVPVIGTDVGGIPDVIEHGKTGLLVSPKDSSAIAKAAILLLRDRELRESMAREAKTRLAQFDWQKIAEQYNKIYQNFYE